MKHYITKYRTENGELIAVAWIQVNLLGKCFCFSKKELVILKEN